MDKLMKTLKINGVVYEIVDAFARDEIGTLQTNLNTANSNIKTLQTAAESARADIDNIKNTAIALDASLSTSGKAADAKATGDEIYQLKTDLNTLNIETQNMSQDINQINSDLDALPKKFVTSINEGVGISVNYTESMATITNSGVRSIATGTTDGTISVNTNGAFKDVSVKGLGSAAYADGNAFMPKFDFILTQSESGNILEIQTQDYGEVEKG